MSNVSLNTRLLFNNTDIKTPQVLLNRVPEQTTEDQKDGFKFIIKINFRVEITIFT